MERLLSDGFDEKKMVREQTSEEKTVFLVQAAEAD
jgi:hypothetical protein